MKSNFHVIVGFFHSDVTVVYQNGLPVISVRLPSRRERCQFTLKPISDSVGVFLRQLQEEDRGIDRVAIYSPGTVTFIINSPHHPFLSKLFLPKHTQTHTAKIPHSLENIFYSANVRGKSDFLPVALRIYLFRFSTCIYTGSLIHRHLIYKALGILYY